MALSCEASVQGRLMPNNPFFNDGDIACHMLKRLGVFDVDTEEFCHNQIDNLVCEVHGCGVALNNVLEQELHYNSTHRFTCATCRKTVPSAHLLDLHVEETHDSFFAVQAERKPMYRCLVESCTLRFTTAEERQNHCTNIHAFPANFRWITPSASTKKRQKSKKYGGKAGNSKQSTTDVDMTGESEQLMEEDSPTTSVQTQKEDKQVRGILFGRGKKSFSSKSYRKTEWHKRTTPSGSVENSTNSVLEGTKLSTDLMESLPIDETA